MRDAIHPELFGSLVVGVIIDVQIGPLKLVLERLDRRAWINIVLHRLARRTPSGRENDDDGFAAFFSIAQHLAVAIHKLWASFGEVLCKGRDN